MIQRRRQLISSLSVAIAGSPIGLGLAQEKKPARVALLSRSVFPEGDLQAFRDGLRDLGQVEGRTYVLELRQSGGTFAKLREFAIEVAASNPDVIFAAHGEAAETAKAATSSIPIVFISLEAGGLVESFARPGGNATGFVNPVNAKKLELLHEMVPTLQRLAFLHVPGSTDDVAMLAIFKTGANVRGLEFLPIAVPSDGEMEAAIEAAVRLRAGGLVNAPGLFFRSNGPRIIELTAKHRLPAIYDDESLVEAGGLMSFGVDRRARARRVAGYVDRILRGAKPGDLPVELPTKFELFINLRTARALGLAVPPALLARADRVIE